MPADIEQFEDGSAAFASARVDAWHQLGSVLPENLTAEDVMIYARLGGWDVRKTPITTVDPETNAVLDVPGKWATVRTNPVSRKAEALGGVVGDWYKPIQNEDHVSFLNALTDQSGAVFETAGSLDGGRRVFVTMKLPEAMTVGGVDRSDLYICAMNSHDGTTAFRTILTPVRVVCSNTLAAAMGNRLSQEHKIRHTGNGLNAVAQARESLALGWEFVAAFEAEAEKLINTPLTSQKTEAVLTRLFGKIEMDGKEPAKGQAQRVRKYDIVRGLLKAPTQENIAGTRWALYNALTEYSDHFRPMFGRVADVQSQNRAEFAVQRGMEFKAEAFSLLTASR